MAKTGFPHDQKYVKIFTKLEQWAKVILEEPDNKSSIQIFKEKLEPKDPFEMLKFINLIKKEADTGNDL